MNINEQIYRMRGMMGLSESVVYDYIKRGDGRYEFKTVDGLIYEVHILPAKGYSFKTYDVSFKVKGKGSEYETKLGLSHLNSVLNTVTEIVEHEIKEKKIRKVIFNPAYGERDVNNGGNKLFNPNLRYELYLRFLSNRYPEDAVLPGMGTIGVDVTKVFPNLFTDSNKMSIVMGLLNNFNDFGSEIQVSDFDGEDENNFSYEGELTNGDKGDYYIELSVRDSWGEYNINLESYDSGEKDEEYFKSFDELIKYIKIKLI